MRMLLALFGISAVAWLAIIVLVLILILLARRI